MSTTHRRGKKKKHTPRNKDGFEQLAMKVETEEEKMIRGIAENLMYEFEIKQFDKPISLAEMDHNAWLFGDALQDGLSDEAYNSEIKNMLVKTFMDNQSEGKVNVGKYCFDLAGQFYHKQQNILNLSRELE